MDLSFKLPLPRVASAGEHRYGMYVRDSGMQKTSRRRLLKQMLGVTAGLAAAPALSVAAESPRQRGLRALVETVCPRPSPARQDALRILQDDAYPLAWIIVLVVAGLDARAHDVGAADFASLAPDERHAALADATASGASMLYEGAIYLTQIGYFAGVYHPERGSPTIGFEGAFTLRAPAPGPYPLDLVSGGEDGDGNPP